VSPARLRAGTSGYAYSEWKGSFYPAKLPAAGRLAYYAERLPAVEINNSFYRLPSAQVLAGWAAQVPESFRFALKAPRRITHQAKLRDAAEATGQLVRVAGTLGGRLGPLLFQLPPFFKRDLPLLADFLALLPADVRAAFEFRNASWFDEAIYAALAGRGVALVVSDREGAAEPPVVRTAAFGYLRLRRPEYDDAALGAWLARIAAQGWDECCVFFKHEAEGRAATLALRLGQLAGAGA
jgi:uncharacterized protein YecE (DUF72 family)